MRHPRIPVLIALILGAASLRLLPHVPDFTPIAAIALFGGAQFSSKRLAFGVPLAAMFLSDLLIGFDAATIAVYASFALVVGLGLLVRRERSAPAIVAATCAGSVLFFLVTNFAVWSGPWYPHTWDGLGACYAAALPFFRNELFGDLFYTAALFGAFALAEKRWPALADRPTQA